MKFIVNEKQTSQGIILIVTDSDIIGKKFEEGNKQLDLTNKFYEGKEKSEEEVKNLIKEAYVLHLTGKEAVALGKELGLVENIIVIDGIEHAEVLLE